MASARRPNPHYKRWVLEPRQTIGALLGLSRRGIYILEFANGDRYVGQTVDFASRFTTHVHGSAHHAPWADIIAVCFWAIPSGDLDAAERSEIKRVAAQGFTLRNKAGNLGHGQPAPLDEVVTVEEQKHWATGAPNYERKGFPERIAAGAAINSSAARTADQAPPRRTKRSSRQGSRRTRTRASTSGARFDAFFRKPAHRKGVWEGAREAILDDLSFLLTEVIPNAVETEKTFWVLTEMPSTAGGRFACLSTGVLELAFFPRTLLPFFRDEETSDDNWDGDLTVHLNFPPKSLQQSPWFSDDPNEHVDLESREGIVFLGTEDGSIPFAITRFDYALTSTDSLALPIGYVRDFIGSQPYLLTTLRKFAISLMRQNPSGMFRRWHSDALVTEVMRHEPEGPILPNHA
ncbi:GIY-YIG nuclease family protein [Corynebacterium heidelbergense]|uniref:GIY-YIG domain-containing protein n=1 Tax=Corynebacterium heidelbergense TaxID=2055947 RepID=A0A364VCZ5_9CORY|nr:GIY-YIG nuclease family protein [Corynebacterium heidelbergense]RAV34501.1 hypothetical protein CWC39_02940 [Corynebacterium heidelbergense]WCZ36149.1 hypothetical protein CHEID_02940 [Corynebacterium heidelbergense]